MLPQLDIEVSAVQPAIERVYVTDANVYDPCPQCFGSYALAACYGVFLYTGLPEGLMIGRYRTGGATA